jgi:hypothetical protein
MFQYFSRKLWVAAIAALAFAALAPAAAANHSWNGYHWARTSNPFTLKVGDSVSTTWDSYLDTALSDWSQSRVLNFSKVAGANTRKNCRPTAGRIEVCADRYGNTGWLGIAQVWVSGSHITQATTKLNDTYFNTATYNTPAWRQLVVCQEVAHDFGLDHQDETFDNVNVGSCMDYTNDPDGGAGGAASNDPSNEHPNSHDYEELEIIYNHLDGTSTVGQTTTSSGRGFGANFEDPASWGQSLRHDSQGRPSLFEQDLGHGNKVFTFVTWTLE